MPVHADEELYSPLAWIGKASHLGRIAPTTLYGQISPNPSRVGGLTLLTEPDHAWGLTQTLYSHT